MSKQTLFEAFRAAKVITATASVAVVSAALLGMVPSAAAVVPTNLIQNPSLEDATISTSTPDHWSTSTYATVVDPVFTYPVQGVEGAGSGAARVEMKGVGGDAKWYFDYVGVSPDSDYVYRSRYRSNTVTRVAVAEEDLAGNFTFPEALNAIPASDAWGDVAIEIHTKPTTVRLSVYHLIESVGWLEIDQASLVTDAPVQYVDGIPNNSVEQVSAVNPELPRAWSHGGWGVNTPSFEYISGDGHEGSMSVRVTVSGYVDGDAKWVYTPQALTMGADYRFTAWYKTDPSSTPRVVARFLDASGTESFFGMPNPLSNGTGDWQQYRGEFSVPGNAVAVNVFFFLSGNGSVQTDDYHIAPYNFIGFDRPLITLTFDDGYEENVTSALPKLNEYGFKSTQCYTTEYIEVGGAEEAAQRNRVMQFYSSGHEVCSHTVTHPSLPTLSPAALETELFHSKAYLEALTSSTVTSFASPFGDYNTPVLDRIKNYYKAHRTVNEGYNSKDNLDVYTLRVQNMKKGTTLAQFEGWVNKAIADKTWLILLYHKVTELEANLAEYDTLTANFNAQMDWLESRVVAHDIIVKRMDAAIAEVTSVPPVNHPPIITAPTYASGTVGSPIQFSVSIVDPDGDPLTVTAGLPQFAVFATSTGEFSWLPLAAGTTTATFAAFDGRATTTASVSLEVFAASVPPVNHAPIITVQPYASGTVGSPIQFTVSMIDPDGDPLTVTAGLPQFAVFATSTGEFSWIPTAVGTTTATFYAFDGTATATATVLLEAFAAPVVPVNPPSGGGGGGGWSGGSVFPVTTSTATSTATSTRLLGAVLGAATSTPTSTSVCTPYLTKNLKFGMRGKEVVKLQEFLNEFTGARLPVTGYFGTLTRAAVNSFQLQHADRILAPLGLTTATGNVMEMTRAVMNEMWCAAHPA
jgi:peptidoglycan/xylan/chitin deacetylase (PgdA/CDA1 family)/peptidoglycan hydrolase-like protein with peptidoglycan-binding domain